MLSNVNIALQYLQLIGRPVAYPQSIYRTHNGSLMIFVVLGIRYFAYSEFKFDKFGIYAFL